MARAILFVLLVMVAASLACPRKEKWVYHQWKVYTTDRNGEKKADIGIELTYERTIRKRRSVELGAPADISAEFFHIIDLNKDGQLERGEWTEEGGKRNEFSVVLKDYDADGDGMISLEEFYDVHLDPSAKEFIEYISVGVAD